MKDIPKEPKQLWPCDCGKYTGNCRKSLYNHIKKQKSSVCGTNKRGGQKKEATQILGVKVMNTQYVKEHRRREREMKMINNNTEPETQVHFQKKLKNEIESILYKDYEKIERLAL